ncbi:MAG: ATP-binding protein [Phycisphaerae bacterium]|nr:ATP-binding protein [Phycisphaerae bacterium]
MTPAAGQQGQATGRDVILSAHDVAKTYQMGRVEVKVLKGASIELATGEWLSILGSSGSGKSTLLHLLGGLDQADEGGGGIRYRQQEITGFNSRQLNTYRNLSVGFVFQFYHLLPELTVMENTVLPAMVARGRLKWYRDRAEITERARELLSQFGLDHRLEHRPRELSGGERQRTAIARALVNQPSILLADEPTGNLDASTGGEILDLIKQQHEQGLSIIMVTHDSTIASQADRQVHLVDGIVQ